MLALRTLIFFLASHISLAILPPLDRFLIFEQMALHQAHIDYNLTCANAKAYASLYWPEATFRVIDPDRDATMTGHQQIRANYDYAHSVFPLNQWRHSAGVFEVSDTELTAYQTPDISSDSSYPRAYAHWNWRVDWRANTTGIVSTGTYNDVYEKRNDTWKLIAKVSRDDANWPLYLFAPYVVSQKMTFRSSCGDTTV